jgi:hypothetical protein
MVKAKVMDNATIEFNTALISLERVDLRINMSNELNTPEKMLITI